MKEQFIRFLKDEHAWDEFNANFKKWWGEEWSVASFLDAPEKEFYEWMRLEYKCPPYIESAFNLEETEEGEDFWWRLSDKWEIKCTTS